MSQFELRPIAAHEIDAYANCQATAFGSRYTPAKVESLERELVLDRSVAAFDGGQLVGASSSYATRMTVPGSSRPGVGFVTDVAVLPTHRRRGLLSAMMRWQLDDMHARGESVSVLFSSEGGIYERYGYGAASYAARYMVDKRLARLRTVGTSHSGAVSIGVPGSVHLIEQAQALEAFPLVREDYVSTRVGELDRPQSEWAELLGDPTSSAEGLRFYACFEQGGHIDGYVVYRVAPIDPRDHWRRAVFLEELCALSDVAYVSLWRYLLGIDLTGELRTRGRPVDEPVRYLFEDQRQFRTVSLGDRSWVRLIDVRRALSQRRYEEQGVLVLDVEDRLCAWNDGRFRISVDGDGIASVERADDALCDIALAVEVLGAAYLGGVPFAAMAEVGRVEERSEGMARRADRMFIGSRPPFCTTNF